MVTTRVGDIPKELLEAIRKEAIQQVAKWAIGAVVLLIAAAAAGWWLALKPWLAQQLGGMPNSAVVAFNAHNCPPGWKAFQQAAGRTIVGAGPPLTTGPDGKLAYDAYDHNLQNVGWPHGGELLIATLTGVSPQPTDFNGANVLPWYRLQYCTNSND